MFLLPLLLDVYSTIPQCSRTESATPLNMGGA